VENRVGRKRGGDVGAAGAGGMDRGQPRADGGGEARIGAAIAQLAFPEPVPRRIEKCHHQRAGCRIFGKERRRRAGRGRVGEADPGGLVAIALDRRFPELRHLQARQRALHADRPGREVDAPDVRRDAAGQRGHARLFAGRDEAGAGEDGADDGGGVGRDFVHLRCANYGGPARPCAIARSRANFGR
jgi:hypothetical protein